MSSEKKQEHDIPSEPMTVSHVEERWDKRISYVRHEINNIAAILRSNFEFVDSEIEKRDLDLGEDGKDALSGAREAIEKLIDLSENMTSEGIDSKMKPFIDTEKPKAEHEEGLLNSEEGAPEKVKSGIVFLIDDEVPVMRALKRTIEGLFQNGDSPNIRIFNSALSAKEAIEEGVIPDYIICDMSMPGMSGRVFYKWLELNHPSLAKKFVFLSGGAINEKDSQLLESMRLKGRALTKPFNAGEIRNLVQECLN